MEDKPTFYCETIRKNAAIDSCTLHNFNLSTPKYIVVGIKRTGKGFSGKATYATVKEVVSSDEALYSAISRMYKFKVFKVGEVHSNEEEIISAGRKYFDDKERNKDLAEYERLKAKLGL